MREWFNVQLKDKGKDEGQDESGNGNQTGGKADDDEAGEDGDESQGGGDGDGDDESETDEEGDESSKEGFTDGEKGEEDEEDSETESKIEQELDEQAEGKDFNERGNDEIEQALKDVESTTGGEVYTSRRDQDEHRVPVPTAEDKRDFVNLFNEMQSEVAAMTMALEQALRALTRCRKEPFLRSGRLDNDRLVEIAKNLSKNIFYQKRQGRELKTAVALVIDQSGSMGCIWQVRDLVLLLGECMYRLGIPFEVIGTTTKYPGQKAPELNGFSRTNPIVYDHYKNFEDQWPVVRERLMNMASYEHNIDGEAVEYAARRLMTRQEERKIVFSLCDGEPCGGQNNDHVLAANITRVSTIARKMGVEVFGVGLGTKNPAKFYGEENFVYLERSENKGEQFVRAFTEILTKGEVRI
jgi:cobalamin biosynthesis protein CobT